MKKIFACWLLCSVYLIAQNPSFVRGVDLSFTPQIEDSGGVYKSNGTAEDPLQIFKQAGVNYVRLRLWHTPANKYCGLQSTIDFAKRIKQAGLKLLIDFHYSDTWADPGKQYKPAAWNNLPYEILLDSIYSYTFDVIKQFDALDILPDMVQVGNEIRGGFLRPQGSTQNWAQFTGLLKQAIKAVHDAASDTVKIMIHIEEGGDNAGSRWFFDNVTGNGVDFDVIGLSYYPWWHGTLTEFRQNAIDLAGRYNKEIIAAETAYPWTLQWYDNTTNILGSNNQLLPGYPATVDGQYLFLNDLIKVLDDVPNDKGLGLFYWAPDWISLPNFGSTWENAAMFDFQGNALSSLKAFEEKIIDTSNAVNVTFTLNNATNADTLKTNGYVQIRGEVGNVDNEFVSGEKITWDINSELIMQNIGGDYWQKTIRAVPGTEISYKYWTGHSRTKATFLRAGSEGPIEGIFRKFIVGERDTVLPVEFYNSTATAANQFWSPFEKKQDSVGIMLRVNVIDFLNNSIFLPDLGDIVIVSPNFFLPEGLILHPESNSIGSSFYSAITYLSKSIATPGLLFKYKFEIVKTGNQFIFEDSIRSIPIPSGDTTLHWVFFNDRKTITSIEENKSKNIFSFQLSPNYPNPFNPTTNIEFWISDYGFVNLAIYDVLGNKITTLINEEKPAGKYITKFDGSKLASGVYFFQLSQGKDIITRKMILTK